MSHSSVANPVARRTANPILNNNPRRRKLSDLGLNPAEGNNCEMALASDSLFDKFGLFAEQVQTCHHSGVQDEAVGAIADTGLADFENLDFADLLEIKDDPIEEQIQLDNDYITNDPVSKNYFFLDHLLEIHVFISSRLSQLLSTKLDTTSFFIKTFIKLAF